MEQKQSYVIALSFCLLLSLNTLNGMIIPSDLELPTDVWPKVFACCTLPSKDILRRVCTTFQRYTPHYLDIYFHHPLIVSDTNIKKALPVALQTHHLNVVDVLLTRSNKHAAYALCQALTLSATSEFEYILKNFPFVDINKPLEGRTLLYRAVDNNNIKATEQLLLCKGRNVDFPSTEGTTPLHLACIKGLPEIVQLLLDNKASLNISCGSLGDKPLHLATRNGHYKTIQILVKSDPHQVNQRNDFFQTPLVLASNNGHWKTIKLLCHYNAHKNNVSAQGGWTALHYASYNGYIRTIKTLLHYPEIRSLVNIPTCNGATALYLATQEGHIDIVKYLLAQDTTDPFINYFGNSCLYAAISFKHLEIMQLLLKHSPALININNTRLCSPLHCSIEKNNFSALKILVNSPRINLNSLNGLGKTPLDSAYEYNSRKIIQFLIKKGAKTFAQLQN